MQLCLKQEGVFEQHGGDLPTRVAPASNRNGFGMI